MLFNESGIRFAIDVPSVSIKRVKFTRDSSIQERFDAFHGMNPQVYSALVEIALQMKHRGYTKGSIVLMYELLRAVNTKRIQTSSDGFGLSDNFRSRYARMIMDRVSDLRNFFNTKELPSATSRDFDDDAESFFQPQKREPIPKAPVLTWNEY
jgi:hypothetical protein